jgi:hypothetical protein
VALEGLEAKHNCSIKAAMQEAVRPMALVVEGLKASHSSAVKAAVKEAAKPHEHRMTTALKELKASHSSAVKAAVKEAANPHEHRVITLLQQIKASHSSAVKTAVKDAVGHQMTTALKQIKASHKAAVKVTTDLKASQVKVAAKQARLHEKRMTDVLKGGNQAKPAMNAERIFAAAARNTFEFLQCEQAVMCRVDALRQLDTVDTILELVGACPAHKVKVDGLHTTMVRLRAYISECDLAVIDDVCVTQEVIAAKTNAQSLLDSSILDIDSMLLLYNI